MQAFKKMNYKGLYLFYLFGFTTLTFKKLNYKGKKQDEMLKNIKKSLFFCKIHFCSVNL